jgi:tetratricopeptide (TPR) repeat protein
MLRPPLFPRALALLAASLMAASLQAADAPADAARDIERLYRSGDAALAAQRLEQALAAQPGSPRLLFLKGVMLSEANREADAMATFERLTQDHPDLPEPYNNLAVLHAARGQLDRARELLELAIRHDPDYFAAQENLGDVFARLAQRAYEKAGVNPHAEPSLQRKLRLARDLTGR